MESVKTMREMLTKSSSIDVAFFHLSPECIDVFQRNVSRSLVVVYILEDFTL